MFISVGQVIIGRILSVTVTITSTEFPSGTSPSSKVTYTETGPAGQANDKSKPGTTDKLKSSAVLMTVVDQEGGTLGSGLSL